MKMKINSSAVDISSAFQANNRVRVRVSILRVGRATLVCAASLFKYLFQFSYAYYNSLNYFHIFEPFEI